MTTPVCPLCKAGTDRQAVKQSTVYGGGSDQSFWRCDACEAIYLYPPTSEEQDRDFYENDFDKWMAKRSGDESWNDPATQFEKLGARELPLRGPWLEKYVKPGMRVLEIGSSSGFALARVKELGAEAVGIEPSPEYAEFACSRGLKTYPGLDAMKEAGEEPFDMVLHYYVLEHVNEPLPFLDACFEWLKPDGTMLFEVPSATDPLTSLYRVEAFDRFYWWRAHHWYFTPASLGYLLGQTGKPYSIHPGQRYDLSNHLVWLNEGRPGGMGRFSHVLSPETERAYREDLKRNWLCDHMIAVIGPEEGSR